MINIDTSGWQRLGATSNTEYFEVEPGILAALPMPGTTDDGRTARENCVFQADYFRQRSAPGVSIVFYDRGVEQTRDARRVYGELMEPSLVAGSVLLGGTLLGRAMASFFLGLAKPSIAMKLCSNLDEALVCAREMLRNARGEPVVGVGGERQVR